MEILISHGHPVDCRDAKGWPPLLYAHFVDHQDCVLALMRAKPAQVREGEGGGGWGRVREGEGKGGGKEEVGEDGGGDEVGEDGGGGWRRG